MLLGTITNRLDDVGIQVFVFADEVPEILSDHLQITSLHVAGASLTITDTQNRLHPQCGSRLLDADDGISQVLGKFPML